MKTARIRALLLCLLLSGLSWSVPSLVRPVDAQCTEIGGCGGASGAPGVSIDPDGGSWSASAASMQVVVTIGYCDESTGFNATSRKVFLDGLDLTASFGWSADSQAGCFTSAMSTGVLTLTAGTHILVASIANTSGQVGADTVTFTYSQVSQPPPGVSYDLDVTPDAKPVLRGPSLRSTERFVVANTGTASTSVVMAPTCTGAGAAGCSVSHRNLTIPGGGIVSVGVNYTTGPTVDTSATVALDAWKDSDSVGVTDAGSHTVKVAAIPAPGQAGDPGDVMVVDRSSCLMLPAALDATYECGDLRLSHTLPATRVLNRAYSPTLLYNSQHAYPYPIVGATVQPSGPEVPTSVVATLSVAGQVLQTATFAGWTNSANRVAVGFDATGLPTGFYSYTLQVRAFYASGRDTTLYAAPGTLPIVNRSESRFGRGWWLAGVEELKNFGSTLMWVGGDGSVLRYTLVSTGRWASEKYAGTDTIVQLDSSFARLIPGGDTVWFDIHGRHVRTSSRRGYATDFTWNGFALTTVSLPRGPGFDTGLEYVFEYNNAHHMLDRVLAPGAGSPRVVAFENSDGRLFSISGPDTTSVRFGYTDPRPRITSRRDRRQVWSHFSYDAGSRLANAFVTTGPGPNDIVPVYYRAQESRGITLTPASQVYTVFNGPRPDSDVADLTNFWVDRRGVPYQVQDAAGAVTRMYREDPSWPGLVTRVRHPNGREVTSSYDDAGRLSATTDWSTSANGRFATTLYEWDERCEALSRVTLPEGEVTSRGYNARCLPEWIQPGHDPARRTRIEYFRADSAAPSLVSAVISPASAAGQPSTTERYAYDPRGNLTSVTTPLGITIRTFADAIGRDTLSLSPIEGTLAVRVRHHYDAMDRDTLTQTIGPAMNFQPEQELHVGTRFDPEGLTLSVSRWSVPDTAGVDTLTDSWRFDALRRAVFERRAAGTRDSLVFDDAGNVVRRFTSRSSQLGPLTMRYDALNRLIERVTPQVSYAPVTANVNAYVVMTGRTQHVGSWTYPHYSNVAGGGLLIAADTARFVYDPTTGAMLEANNRDAQIRRSYYDNGALRTDSLFIRTWDGADFNKHRYGIEHIHDLNGRQIELRHPGSIAPRNSITGQLYDRETYGYDPLTGALNRITSVLGHDFRFFYDLLGRLDSLSSPGLVGEKLTYDADGRLKTRAVYGSNYSTSGLIHGVEYTYDLRGKQVSVAGSGGGEATLAYSGLGMLVHVGGTRWGPNTQGIIDERYAYDALGNRITARSSPGETAPTYSYYDPSSGRLDYSEGPSNTAWESTASVPPRMTQKYDDAGNLSIYHLDDIARQKHDHTRHYYGADDKLRASERWTCQVRASSFYTTLSGSDISAGCEPAYRLNSATAGSFEEYRYDALGRRVLVRSRRKAFCTHASCAGTITRTVWNGDQVLYEIRAPGDEGASASTMESDTVSGHPFFGRVTYTHGGGIDRPLEVIRIGYTPQPSTGGDYQLNAWGGPHPMILHTNWRGMVDEGTTAQGRRMPCQQSIDCPVIRFPAASYKAYNQSADLVERQTWYGSLIEEKADDSGLMYMRNRYYNPATGQFTQEDPIGIAGGLNTYGFANADPVTFDDPYGLTAQECCDEILASLTIPQPIVDFAAGFGDAASFGLTDLAREAIGDNAAVSKGSGAYNAGQATEFGVELVATAGSAALKRAAAKVPDRVARTEGAAMIRAVRNERRGGIVHHVNPLAGHPGGKQSFFPMRGLPASVHSGRWNLRHLSDALHATAHQRLMRAEAVASAYLNRWAAAARAVLSVNRSGN